MRCIRYIKGVACIAALFFGQAIFAGITVQPLILHFGGKNRYQDVMVYNTGKSNAYVNVTSYKNTSHQKGKKHWAKFKGAPMRFGLIVSQNKLVIPPHQTRYVRVLEIGHSPKTPELYKLNFSPATGKLETVHFPGGKVVAGVRVVVSYDVIAHVA